MPTTKCAVAICGSDQWLRHHLSRRLSQDVPVSDVSSGTSYLNGVATLLIVPHLAPCSRSGTRDVAMQQALHTINAAHAFGVGRVVLVSRVGPAAADDSYPGALAALERSASASFKKLTIVRLTHPFGPPDDPGPLIQAMAALDDGLHLPDTTVQPIYRDDAVEAIAAAAAGRYGAGVVEVGGPDTMPVAELVAYANAVPASSGKPAGRRSLFKRNGPPTVEEFVALESITHREYVPSEPTATCRLRDVWPTAAAKTYRSS